MMIPKRTSGPIAIEGRLAVLMPLAISDGAGVDPDVAITSYDQIMPTTVAIRQKTASKSATTPAKIIQRVARVRGTAVNADPGS
jgi:hypothetical protein